jgi:hypothetical protein
MNLRLKSWALLGAGLLIGSLAPRIAVAQIYYPAFQVPQIVDREFNFAVADAEHVTTFVFQWREGVGAKSQLSFDVGLADVDGPDSDLMLILGGQYGYQITRAAGDNPLDVLFTAGAFALLGDDNRSAVSLPVGVVLGHRFELESPMAITPFIHPRLSVDIFDDDSELNINFDIGTSFEINNRLGLRFAATLGEVDAVGLSLSWRPQGIRR